MVMIRVNIYEVKAKLSEFVDRAARGEHIVICRHNKPVAELRAMEDTRTDPRPVGPLPGRPTFEIPASFFDPMPGDELDLWDRVAAKDPLSTGWTSRRRTSKARPSSRRRP
jgi:prevent-host-death family protein